MRGLVASGLAVLAVSGCAPGPVWIGPQGLPMGVVYDNPTLVRTPDHRSAWETVVDVVDDYFRIEREEPVRLIANTLTEGRLETYPKVAATILEPWHQDSVGGQEKIESTLQSIRRRATVRVVPAEEGYWVDVVVFKELEDVVRPEHATAGAATFRYDDSLTRVVNPVGGQEITEGWIPQGRDTALEQRIIEDLHARCGQVPVRMLPPVVRGE